MTRKDQTSLTQKADTKRIGEILTHIGKLSDSQVRDIIEYQDTHSVTFGQAAIALEYLSYEDIDQALAQQFDYAIVEHKNESKFSDELCVVLEPHSIQSETFRVLRSQLMLNCLEKGRRALTIASPTENCGCTFTAANLALSMAQLNLKTCLIDANLRSPRIAEVFGLDDRLPGLSGILRGAREYDDVIQRDIFPNFAVLTSGQIPPNPQELIAKHELIWTLSHLLREFDVVLFDTPPMNTCADARTIAARVGSAMLVVRRNHSLASDTKTSVHELRQSGAEVIGTVLNQY